VTPFELDVLEPFNVEPKNGILQPFTSTTILVSFQPKVYKLFQLTSFSSLLMMHMFHSTQISAHYPVLRYLPCAHSTVLRYLPITHYVLGYLLIPLYSSICPLRSTRVSVRSTVLQYLPITHYSGICSFHCTCH